MRCVSGQSHKHLEEENCCSNNGNRNQEYERASVAAVAMMGRDNGLRGTARFVPGGLHYGETKRRTVAARAMQSGGAVTLNPYLIHHPVTHNHSYLYNLHFLAFFISFE
ncbi:hypothetical protein AVEN_239373-1 [Araneus ventricosus]|uniref:Uncharacterized protein n=1 Tax=Araneus ventricosus TaxID=182803 RepID=A0A4Y2EE79_ARAVE|nr:hypothetical protein AVEN_239373-1 [Araneus ventricosus]